MNLLDLMIKVGVDDQASSELGRIVDGVKNAIDNIQRAANTARNVGDVIAEGFSRATKAVETVTEKVSDIGEAVQETSSSAKLAAHNIETPFTNAAKNVVGQVKTIGSAFEPIANTAKSAINGISTAFGGISDAAKKAVEKAKSTLEDLASKAKKVAETVGNSLKTAFSVVASAVGVAAGAFAALGGAALNATGELEQNSGGLLQVFKENAAEMEAVAKSAYGNMGLSASDFMGTANQIGALLQGSGFGIAESATLAAGVMQRASDVASIMGIDIPRAMESIAGAAKGNFTMMDNLGVAINDTTIAQYALSKGITTSTREMTTQEKVGLAMELFMEKSAYAAGNYARENKTLAGSFATARAAMSNFLSGAGSASDVISSVTNAAKVAVQNVKDIAPRLAEGIGEIASGLAGELPALFEAVVPAVVSGAKSILGGLLATVRESAGSMLRTISDVFYEFTGIDLTPLIGSLTEVANMIRGTLGGMLDGIDLAGVAATVNGFLTTLAGAISSVVSAVQGEAFQNFVGAIKELFSSVSGAVKDALKPVADGIKELFQSFLSGDTGIITSITDAVKAFTELFNSTLAPIMEAVGQAIVTMFTPFVEGLSDIIKAVANAVDGIFQHASKSEAMKVLAEAIVKLFGVFSEFLGSAIETVALAFTKLIEAMGGEAPGVIGAIASALAPVVNFITTLGEDLTVVVEKIKDFIENIFDIETTVEDVFGSLGEIIGSAVGAVVNAFDNFFTKVKEKIDNIKRLFAELDMSKLLGGLGDWASNTWGDIKEGAGALWDGITEGFEEQRNRQTARETYATPQAVVPYENSVSARSTADTANAILSGISNNGGGKTANINLNVDGRTVASAVYDPLNDIVRQKGAKQ